MRDNIVIAMCIAMLSIYIIGAEAYKWLIGEEIEWINSHIRKLNDRYGINKMLVKKKIKKSDLAVCICLIFLSLCCAVIMYGLIWNINPMTLLVKMGVKVTTFVKKILTVIIVGGVPLSGIIIGIWYMTTDNSAQK